MSRKTVAWTTAGAFTIAGCIVVIVGLLTPVSFGWFAYQPLANATFTPAGSGVYVSRITIAGLVILTLGLLALAFLAGVRAGANRRS
ncbi:hypothetical protein [Microbacterium cremeum]|uniref:hypothetical protein n=1 Tax=Microbacterium cremeum TaxID=2782169 RepID=UPI001887D5E7|nr:hypothetical protein [Microbacterium cremeum]